MCWFVEDERCGACSRNGRDEKCMYTILEGKPEGRGRLGYLGLYDRTILKLIFKKQSVSIWNY
jgi:hypothetical protein